MGRFAFSAARLCGLLCAASMVTAASASETITYTYDALGRVAGVSSSGSVNNGQAVSINYDAAGNRTNYTVTGASLDLSVADASATEGGNLVFTVTLSSSSASTVTVAYATSNGTATAGSDYTSASGALTFSPGQISKTVTVSTTDDTSQESSETVLLTLSSPSGAGIADGTATGTINDNDQPLTLSVADASASEGSNLTFTVSLSQSSGSLVTVNYATADGTASAGADYTAASGALAFAPGETSKSVTVTTSSDSYVESAETMALNLSSPSGATIADGSGIGTINNSGSPSVTFAISDATVTEGGNLSFTVTKSGFTLSTITVNYATADGSAVAGSDYTSTSGSLSFSLLQYSKTITVPTTQDTVAEATENLTVTLSSPSGGSGLTDWVGVGTINDND